MSGEASHKLIILTCIVISIISLLYVLYSYKTNTTSQKPSSTPPVAFANQTQPTTDVESSDGKFKLSMLETKEKSDIVYTFSVLNEDTGSATRILSKTVSLDTTMSIPLNSFSPDDKYVFLKETTGDQNSYWVLTSSGANLTNDSQTEEISSVFMAKYQNYKITDVTGWGGMNLIVINTDKTEGGIGPSFWFEVPSKAIIPLSNRFN